MKNWDRILATLLSALMLCAMLPVSVLADDVVISDMGDLEITLDGTETPKEDSLTFLDGIDLKMDEIDELNGDIALDVGIEEEKVQASELLNSSNSFTDGDYDHDAFDINANGELVAYYGPGGDVVIPEGVTVIGESAFSLGYWGGDNETITSITMPDSVSIIEDGFDGWYEDSQDYDNFVGAFAYCINLKHIYLSNNLTYIGKNAFRGCSRLTSIYIPASVASIGESAFAGCMGLKTFTVAEDNPFLSSHNNVLFDKGMSTLIWCPVSVTGYRIPDGVEHLGEWAFAHCKYLAGIKIPGSVITIGKRAFYDCDSLKKVVIPNGVTSIGESAFEDCENLMSVNIPYSVKRINDYTFYACKSLTNVNGQGDVNIPSSVTYIGKYAFALCRRMGSLTIPKSVTKIDDGAFYACSNLSYTCIPSSVTYVGEDAFHGCTDLKNVTIFAKSITFNESSDSSGTFRDCSDDLILYSWENCNTYKWLKNEGYPVKALPDYFLLVSGNTTQKVQVGDYAWIVLDGPKKKSYTSNNKNVATVASNGQLTLKKTGTAKITAMTTTGGKWVLTLNVVAAPKLSKSALSLKAGRSAWLSVNGLLAGRTVTWFSSNSAIASVNKGRIVAKKPGSCNVYAQVKNGVKLRCTVTVKR